MKHTQTGPAQLPARYRRLLSIYLEPHIARPIPRRRCLSRRYLRQVELQWTWMENVRRRCERHTTAGSYTLDLRSFGTTGGVAADLDGADVANPCVGLEIV